MLLFLYFSLCLCNVVCFCCCYYLHTYHLLTTHLYLFHISLCFTLSPPNIRIRIPLEFANADLSDDIRRGCFIVSVNKFLECQCSGEIPQKLLVDLTGCKKNDVITLSNIILPSGVSPSTKVSMRKFVVGVVKSSRG